MALHKEVRITLHTKIMDQGESEENEHFSSGRFYRNPAFDVVKFDEKIKENTTVRSLITIQEDKVTIKRTGTITMNQKFHVNKITENVYRHPHGTIHMETFTDTIRYEPIDKMSDGRLTIFYHVKLNGQAHRKHELTLTLKEENS